MNQSPDQLTSYAQFGEDLQLLDFFGNQSPGYYVEVGANDGISGSNTALLEKLGWKGILVEPNPDLIPLIQDSRTNSQILWGAAVAPEKVGTIEFYQVVGGPPGLHGLSTTVQDETAFSRINDYGGTLKPIHVTAKTLDDILLEYQAPQNFQLLSIDVEGAELDVLKGFSLDRYQPRVILLEDNSHGADWSVRNYLRQRNYIRVHRTGVNDWYVQSKDAAYFAKQRVILMLRLGKWAGQRWWRSLTS